MKTFKVFRVCKSDCLGVYTGLIEWLYRSSCREFHWAQNIPMGHFHHSSDKFQSEFGNLLSFPGLCVCVCVCVWYFFPNAVTHYLFRILNKANWVCFVWFDSLRPINNLSVIKGRVFLGWTSTKLGLMFLLKHTTQWCCWGWHPPPLGLESSTLPLSHCVPRLIEKYLQYKRAVQHSSYVLMTS